MIPKVTQDAPNILPQYWCSQCGRKLLTINNYLNIDSYTYCPGCGEFIEWDEAQPIKWKPMVCDTCGAHMISEVTGIIISHGNYVGTTTCRSCMEEYCSTTNCLACIRGSYPNCKWNYLKRRTFEEAGET